jgi:hypothetical protein
LLRPRGPARDSGLKQSSDAQSLSGSAAGSRSKITARNLAHDPLEALESSDEDQGNEGLDPGLIADSRSQPPLSRKTDTRRLVGNALSDAALPAHQATAQSGAPGAIFNDRRVQAAVEATLGGKASRASLANATGQPPSGHFSYLVKNPTAHELSNSRLVVNSRAPATEVATLRNAPGARAQRLRSAIHQGNLRRSFVYDEQEGAHGQRVGLVAKDGSAAPKTGELSINGFGGGHSEAAKIAVKMERMTSAGRATGTNASSVVRDGHF